MKVAVNGCCHGELDALYGMIERMKREKGVKIDLLICCGDFESLRSSDDLRFFRAPPKYRFLKDFHRYFRGERRAPVLTLVVGGNHEAPNVLRELYYGGWLAPNIFYLGHSGVVRVGGLRIAGLSGIYDRHDFSLGHFERPPYDDNTARSAYHVRQFELLKLHCVKEPVDIMLSHDWPEGIYDFGDKEDLLRSKPYFREDVQRGCLGSPASMALLRSMKPSFWFSGHMHVAFPAVVPHPDGSATRFMAVDKVLPNRRCLQVLDIHPNTPSKYLKMPSCQTNIATHLTIEYDVEWLAILRANQMNIPTSRSPCKCHVTCPSDEDRVAVLENLRHLAALGSTGAVEPSGVVPGVRDKEPTAGIELRAHRGGDARGSEEENSGEEGQSFPWPPWTDPPFQQLEEQRRRVLQVIGMEEKLLGDFEAYERDAGAPAPRTSTNGPDSGGQGPVVKLPAEEIPLDLDDI